MDLKAIIEMIGNMRDALTLRNKSNSEIIIMQLDGGAMHGGPTDCMSKSHSMDYNQMKQVGIILIIFINVHKILNYLSF